MLQGSGGRPRTATIRPLPCTRHGRGIAVTVRLMRSTTTATQNLDQVTALATRYVEEHLDGDTLQWGEVLDHLKARD